MSQYTENGHNATYTVYALQLHSLLISMHLRFSNMDTHGTECYDWAVSFSVSYSGGLWTKSWASNWLSWPRFFTVFLSPSRQILEQYLKLGHAYFLPHPSQLLNNTALIRLLNDRRHIDYNSWVGTSTAILKYYHNIRLVSLLGKLQNNLSHTTKPPAQDLKLSTFQIQSQNANCYTAKINGH
jgi:hypothetical protein